LSYTFMSILAGLISPRADVILCVNPPITVGFSGWLVRLAHRAPMVFNVQDVWPDCLEIIGQVKSRLLLAVFRRLEKLIYRVSSRITVLSGGMKQNLVTKKVPEKKITVIPNWADTDLIRPLSGENSFRTRHDLDGKFVVLFAGNIGFIAMLNSVLDAAGILRDQKNIHFLIVGEGNAKANLMARAKAMGLPNVTFLPTQPKETLPEMLGAADISLVTLNRDLGKLNVPSKTYSIMASSRPVLAAVPDDSEIALLVKLAECGVCVPPEDPQTLADAVLKLSTQPALLEQLGSNGRRYVTGHFERKTLTARYRQLLHDVAHRAWAVRGQAGAGSNLF
jgi:colanic acid biosynthesis glycosyl transferase WcaI